ncbi:hypothetical protein SLA2020_262200 [Shorea laevis]
MSKQGHMLSRQDLFRKFYYSLNCSDKATDIPSQVEEMSEHEVIPEKPKPHLLRNLEIVVDMYSQVERCLDTKDRCPDMKAARVTKP